MTSDKSLAALSFTDGLNTEQELAVKTIDGPLLVLAGAGTGKTRVLVSRIANIIFSNHALPEQVLALTFTNKAANEMKERVGRLISIDPARIWLGTFHSIGLRILRIYYYLCGLRQNFAIADESDKLKIIKQISTELSVDDKRYPAKLIAALMSSLKERMIDHLDHHLLSTERYYDLDVSKIYQTYQSRLISYNMADFDDLIFRAVQVLSNNESVLQELQDRFRYVLVDEYQDTSASQQKLLSLLASGANNICCVGDEDQSIYSWRGAEVSNIMNFKSNFPGALIVRLESNYRSTGNILHLASSLISANKTRYGKVLRPIGAVGEKVRIIGVENGSIEARRIVAIIGEYIDNGKVNYSNIAILARTASQMRPIEEALIAYCIPYRIVDSVKFYDRKEIRDVIAYLRLSYNFSDYISFSRIVNVPRRGVGAKTIEVIRQRSELYACDLVKTLDVMLATNVFGPKVKAELDVLVRNLRRWQSYLQDESYSLSELVELITQQSGYVDMLKEEPEDESAARLENLRELYSMLTAFEDIDGFLEHIALFSSKDLSDDEQQDMVNIMTMHAAKGLEFDMVLLPGWDEGIFPSYRALDDNGEAALEEERRLAYVAITRSKKYLTILHANSRFIYGKWQTYTKSCFIRELLSSVDEASYIYQDYSNNRVEFTAKQGYSQVSGMHRPRYGGFDSGKNMSSSVNRVIQNTPSNVDGFKSAVGDVVLHDRFGLGNVVSLVGDFVEVKFNADQSRRLIQKNFLKKT